MPTYRIKTPLELIQTLQNNKKLRDQQTLGTKDWFYYDELFTNNLEMLATLFNSKNEVVEVKKYACK